LQGGGIDAPLLLLGLAYRESSRAMEVEPDPDPLVPVHLVKSPFGIGQMNKIEKLLDGVVVPSSK